MNGRCATWKRRSSVWIVVQANDRWWPRPCQNQKKQGPESAVARRQTKPPSVGDSGAVRSPR
jgi:hypothetical protein